MALQVYDTIKVLVWNVLKKKKKDTFFWISFNFQFLKLLKNKWGGGGKALKEINIWVGLHIKIGCTSTETVFLLSVWYNKFVQ